MNNKVIQAIKEKLSLSEIDISLIFQDGYQIYYDGEYILNINDL